MAYNPVVPVSGSARPVAAVDATSITKFYRSLEEMMKQLKVISLSLLIGVAIGMWFGVNIGREVPFYSNPFDAHKLNEQLKGVAGETLEKGGHALERTGQSLQDKLNK